MDTKSPSFGYFDSGIGSNISTSSSSFDQSLNTSLSENDSTKSSGGPSLIDTNAQDDLPCIRINGRKVYGPPSYWIGPPPNTCELFIKHIPRVIDESVLLDHFRRIGVIYEFRLMVDFKNENRGFAYVRYVDEASTSMAIDLLNHFYVGPNRQLIVERSYDKCSLFIGNISKEWSCSTIESELLSMFTELSRVVIAPINARDVGNHAIKNGGYVFLDFPTHNSAVRAKQQTSTGRCRLWGRDVKIVWANPKENYDKNEMSQVKTIYVGNVDMSVTQREIYTILGQFIQRELISNVARSREVVFISFSTREAAQHVFDCMQGIVIKNRVIVVKWGKPPKDSSLHGTITIDYDAQLRLMCFANNWIDPIFVFGHVFELERVQSVAVTIGHPQNPVTIYMEHCFTADLQARAAEIVFDLITKHGGLPELSYVIKVETAVYHIVGILHQKSKQLWFQKANDLPTKPPLVMFVNEILQLAMCVEWLMSYLPLLKGLHARYLGSFIREIFVNNRVFGCLNSAHRKFTVLRHGLDQSQLLFVMCLANTASNYLGIAAQPVELVSDDLNLTPYGLMPYKVITLLNPKSANITAVCFGPTPFFVRPVDG